MISTCEVCVEGPQTSGPETEVILAMASSTPTPVRCSCACQKQCEVTSFGMRRKKTLERVLSLHSALGTVRWMARMTLGQHDNTAAPGGSLHPMLQTVDVCILGWLGKGSGDMDVKFSGKVAAGRRQVEAGQRRSLQRVRCRALSCNLTAESKATAVLPQQSHDSTFHS